MRDPGLNKGLSFTAVERSRLGLEGLIPSCEDHTMEAQLDRAYYEYSSQPTDLAKHLYMANLHDTNETLFYALMQRHLLEMLPVVYDPVVGEAIENFSRVWGRPRGAFLSIDRPDEVEARLANLGLGPDEVDLVVASDAEEILGIGDWGANGIDISVGKLAVYTAAAGIDPYRVVPVMLDVGTDNARLLNDPLYIGYRHARVRGQRYDEFLDAYVRAARKLFPDALLHWEDFGVTNARRLLDRYRGSLPTFNDDMQGTAAITMAGLFNAVELTGVPWSQQRAVIFGAGTAGGGIADQIADQMVRDGLPRREAQRRVWLVDIPGLLVDTYAADLREYQRPYARPAEEVAGWARSHEGVMTNPAMLTRWPDMAAVLRKSTDGIISLATTVSEVKPTILIGTSTSPRRFSQHIVEIMAAHVARPIIFPLSNPTPLAEATPQHLLTWTSGAALVATGSPFDDVRVGSTTYAIGQANNAALYPGLGLGVVVSRAAEVTDEMLHAAAVAVAGQADTTRPGAALLPSNADLRSTSAVVAVEVARVAQEQGLARAELNDLIEDVHRAMWQAEYVPVEAV